MKKFFKNDGYIGLESLESKFDNLEDKFNDLNDSFYNLKCCLNQKAFQQNMDANTYNENAVLKMWLKKLYEAFPKCMVWYKGSGGHRYFKPCEFSNAATYWDDADCAHFCCDIHLPKANQEYIELSWADTVRAYLTFLKTINDGTL